MDNPFLKNGYLLQKASLNLLPLSGAADTAKARCSSETVGRKVCAFLRAQGEHADGDWRVAFARCLDDPARAGGARAVAEAIADDIADILWTLRRGGGPAVRPDWTAAQWEYWRGVDSFCLAGGLLSGRLGEMVVDRVRLACAGRGLGGARVRLAPHPGLVSLLGAARYAARRETEALVVDFGHSYIKRGALRWEAGRPVLHVQQAIPAQWTQWTFPSDAEERQAAAALHDHMVQALVDLDRQTGAACRTVIASVANYVQDGCVVERGGYGKLRLLGARYDRVLQDALSARLGRPVNVHLLHDGTAGAYGVQGAHWRHEAFIGFGTSLSVGFPCAQMDFPFACAVVQDGR